MSKLSTNEILPHFNQLAKDFNFNLDICIEQLKNCYLLQECQMKILCEKVNFSK